ncbi:hypothetical protein [Streptomyces asiaticus]
MRICGWTVICGAPVCTDEKTRGRGLSLCRVKVEAIVQARTGMVVAPVREVSGVVCW